MTKLHNRTFILDPPNILTQHLEYIHQFSNTAFIKEMLSSAIAKFEGVRSRLPQTFAVRSRGPYLNQRATLKLLSRIIH